MLVCFCMLFVGFLEGIGGFRMGCFGWRRCVGEMRGVGGCAWVVVFIWWEVDGECGCFGRCDFYPEIGNEE